MAHPLLAEKYVTHPIVCADHQGGLVAVSFKDTLIYLQQIHMDLSIFHLH